MTRAPYTIAYYTIRAHLRTVDAVEILREREDRGCRAAGRILDAIMGWPVAVGPGVACYRPAVPPLLPPHV